MRIVSVCGSIAYDLIACRAFASDQVSLDIIRSDDRNDKSLVCTLNVLVFSHVVSDMELSPIPIGDDLIASASVCAGKLETTKDPRQYVLIPRQAMADDIASVCGGHKMGSCVFQCDVPLQWIAQSQVGPVSAAWHSCEAAHWSKYHCYK